MCHYWSTLLENNFANMVIYVKNMKCLNNPCGFNLDKPKKSNCGSGIEAKEIKQLPQCNLGENTLNI